MNPQELIEKYPIVKQILKFFDQYAGLLLLCVFAVLMIYIFYWIIVIAPRRVRRVFAEFLAMGYSTIDPDSQEISQIVTQLAPIYPRRPRKDQEIPEWEKHLAIKLDTLNNATRYVVNVSRSQVDQVGIKMNSTLRKTNLILEKRKLQFTESVYIYPVKNRCSVLWEWRYKLKKISTGLDKEFLEKCHVYSKSGRVQYFPSDFRDVLMNSCASLCDTSLYCFQGGVTLKFQKEGWGICPANEIYKFKDMKVLIEIVDAISKALN